MIVVDRAGNRYKPTCEYHPGRPVRYVWRIYRYFGGSFWGTTSFFGGRWWRTQSAAERALRAKAVSLGWEIKED
jgi:hypothetical protein